MMIGRNDCNGLSRQNLVDNVMLVANFFIHFKNETSLIRDIYIYINPPKIPEIYLKLYISMNVYMYTYIMFNAHIRKKVRYK